MTTNDPTSSLGNPADRGFTPPRVATFGMWLFLIALGMLFASSMLGYVLIRTGPQSTPRGSLHLPAGLWLSTALILLSSLTFHQAVHSIRHERHRPFRNYLFATLLLALGFVAVQTPSLLQLLDQHRLLQGQRIHIYGLVFFLILLHALHVLGGIVALIRVNRAAAQRRYDHENYHPVHHAAMYWHFLDGVWLVMFAILYFTA